MTTDDAAGKMEATAIRDPVGRATPAGVRDHNERLVLSLIQRHGALASAEIARRSSLSAQTVSTIIRGLEKDGLLIRGEPIRGRVGKPSIPMALNPGGVLSLGLNIGRKSADLVLIDFAGTIRAQAKRTYPYPTPEVVMRFVAESLPAVTRPLAAARDARLAGIGVAEPFELWNWLDIVNAPKAEMQAWHEVDLEGRIAAITGLPVILRNDATAACTAEHVFGRGREFADYAYFFIGSFIGGGVVLNDTVYTGRTGNAGAFGSIPVAGATGAPRQLIDHASIFLLERRLAEAGIDPAAIWDPATDWSGFGPALDAWIEHTARHLAIGVVAVSAVIDFERILIEANSPPEVRRRLVERTREAVAGLDTQGIDDPVISEASVGRNARAIGAAALPILDRYLLSQPRFG